MASNNRSETTNSAGVVKVDDHGFVHLGNNEIRNIININRGDFSIIKVDPPQEYQRLGHCLSRARRKEAEDGPIHTVARKLDLLLCENLPEIPNLVKADGKRASEIAQDPKANRKGTALDGAFQDHIGIDATSLWASVTSGERAIALHLLACMLSRIWKQKAVSIWAEIVTRRKTALEKKLNGQTFSLDEVLASRIQLSREQLADWDASTRAWLQSADVAFSERQTQLMLIYDDLQINLPSGTNIYEVITDAWKVALEFMENIVAGKPQAIKNGEVLLAMSAWHLYPDLEVLHGKTQVIKQNDPLILPGGIVTIGLQNPNVHDKFGLSWSLPLSHVRYYGKAVLTTANVNVPSSRISMDQLTFVVMGSLMGTWIPTITEIETFAKLLIFMKLKLADQPDFKPAWFTILCHAASAFLETSGEARAEASKLVGFGKRNAQSFLSTSPDKQIFAPWLGLTQACVFSSMVKNPEAGISWLRKRYRDKKQDQEVQISKFNLDLAVISYMPDRSDTQHLVLNSAALLSDYDHGIFTHLMHPDRCYREYPQIHEFATLSPIDFMDGPNSDHRWVPALSRNPKYPKYRPVLQHSGYHTVASVAVKRRAQIVSDKNESVTFLSDHFFEDWRQDCAAIMWKRMSFMYSPSIPLLGYQLDTPPTSSTGFESGALGADVRLPKHNQKPSLFQTLWKASVKKTPLEEEIERISAQLRTEFESNPEFQGLNLKVPLALSIKNRNYKEDELEPAKTDPISSVDWVSSCEGGTKTPRTMLNATWSCMDRNHESTKDCLYKWYIQTESYENTGEQRYRKIYDKPCSMNLYVPDSFKGDSLDCKELLDLSPEELLAAMETEDIDSNKLAQYLSHYQILLDSKVEYSRSLAAFSCALDLYKKLPEARVELSITKSTLAGYSWAKEASIGLQHARSFACISSFETGYLDVDIFDLKDVMGISVGNSLYIAQFLWSDPYSMPSAAIIRRSIGNVGKPGMAFLISPQTPLVKEPECKDWRHIQHSNFNGTFENNSQRPRCNFHSLAMSNH